MLSFEEEFERSMFYSESGVQTELHYDEETGQVKRRIKKPDIRDFPDETGTDDQLNPFAMPGEATDMPVGEFMEKTGEVATGALAGAAGATAGVPGDIVGLVEGGVQAAKAPEGKGVEAFLQGMAEVSERMGSELFVKKFESFVQDLDIDEDSKQNLLAGSKYIGEMAGLPGAGALVTKGPATIKQLRSALKAKPDQGPAPTAKPTAGMEDAEADPFPNQLPYEQLPQRTNISDMERGEWMQLEEELKISQPIITVADATKAAERNQKVLGGAGAEIAQDLGVEFKNPGVKGQGRIAAKAAERGDVRQLTDVSRGGFFVESTQQADQVVDDLLERGFKVIDEGYNVTSAGYFDRKILIINPDGQVGEVQVLPKSVAEAKDKQGHKLYSIIRDNTKTDQQRADAQAKSIELYGQVLSKLDDDFKQIAIKGLQDQVKKGRAKDGDKSAAEMAEAVLDKIGATSGDQ